MAGDAVVFTIGAHSFDWDDVKTAAVAWGEWERLAGEVREGLSCVAFLSADEAEISGEELDAAAEVYREDRNLIAAEEMSAWLEARGLDAEDWLEFLERSLARRRCADGLAEILRDFPVAADAVGENLHAEVVCSGLAGRVARRLAAAVAPRLEEGEDPPLRAGEVRQAWVRRVCATFADAEQEARSEPSLERAVALHPLDWMTVDARIARFAEEDAAREALLCVTEESADLRDVAAEAGAEISEETLLVQEVDAAIHARLVAAEPGEIVGPYAIAEEFGLLLVVAKTPPHVGNPRVRAEAERRVLAALVDRGSSAAHFVLDL